MVSRTAQSGATVSSIIYALDGNEHALVLPQCSIFVPEHAREETGVGIETGIEEKGRRGAECPREAGFERYVGMVVEEEAGAA